MATEYIHGKQVIGMKACGRKDSKMGMAPTSTGTVKHIQESLKVVNHMEKGNLTIKMGVAIVE